MMPEQNLIPGTVALGQNHVNEPDMPSFNPNSPAEKGLNFIHQGCGQLFEATMKSVLYRVFEGKRAWHAERSIDGYFTTLIERKGITLQQAKQICQKDFDSFTNLLSIH